MLLFQSNFVHLVFIIQPQINITKRHETRPDGAQAQEAINQ